MTTDEQASHSPGPWTLDWNIAGGGTHPEFPELHYVCVRSREADSVTRELSITGYVRPADARLIRAAPDLLALAKQYAAECARCLGIGRYEADGDPSRVATESCSECADIRAVIAKAEGRS